MGYLLNKIITAVCAELGPLTQISQCHVTTALKGETTFPLYHSASSSLSNYTEKQTFLLVSGYLHLTSSQCQIQLWNMRHISRFFSVEVISYMYD